MKISARDVQVSGGGGSQGARRNKERRNGGVQTDMMEYQCVRLYRQGKQKAL